MSNSMKGFDPDRELDEAARRRLSPTALKVALRIGEKWALDQGETLVLIGLPKLPHDTSDFALSSDQFYRAGLLILIFRELHELFGPGLTDRWPVGGNRAPLFGGRSACKFMAEGGADAMVTVLMHIRAMQQGL